MSFHTLITATPVTMAITLLKQLPIPIGEQTVSDCPSIFMLIIKVKERTQRWGVREEDTEDKMRTSDRGGHTTVLGKELHGLCGAHS